MHSSADLTLYDPGGRPTAIVEIKNKLGTSSEWAAKTRRNLLAHSGFSSADFFLLVTPDRLYVWKDPGADPVETPPTYEADAEPIFAPYLKRARVGPHLVSSHAFELLVSTWLGDIIRSSEIAEENSNNESWLTTLGFRTAIKNSRIKFKEVA